MKKLLLLVLAAVPCLLAARPAAAQWTETEVVDAQGVKALNMQFVEAHEGRLYLASFNRGLFRSDDGGDTWAPVNEGLTDLTPRALAFGDGEAYVAIGGRGPFRSTDGGDTWTAPGTGLPTFYPAYASVAVHDGSVFAGTTTNHQVFGVWRSDDKGATWRAVGDVTVPHAIHTLFSWGADLFAGTNRGVYRTQDKGETWTKLENGLPGNSYVRKFVVDGETLYAVADDAVYRSADRGASWTRHNDGFPSFPQPSGLAVRAGHVFTVVVRIGEPAGQAYYSPLDPIAWTAAGDNLAGQMTGLLGAYGDYVYASANNGLWRRPLSDFGISTVDNASAALPGAFRLEQNYPNPFNPSTTIRFAVPAAGRVVLKVFDLLGRERATLVDGVRAAGTHTVALDAAGLPSGRYLYRLEAGGRVETRVMALIR